MTKPNATHYNPDPAYFRGLFKSITDPELLSNSRQNRGKPDQQKVADRIGVNRRTLIRYLDGTTPHPYPVQYVLEQLVGITYDTII